MDVHFCDICNESVPERDLERGRAYLRKGRVVCAACDAAMGTGSEPALAAAEIQEVRIDAPPPAGAAHVHASPAAPAGAGLAMVLASLGILLTASVAVLLFERMDQAGQRADQGQRELRAELRAGMDGLRDELVAGAAARVEERRGLDRAITSQAEREVERAKLQADALARLDAEIADVGRALQVQVALADQLALQERRASELADALGELRADVGLIAEKVLELEQRALSAVPAAPAAAGPEADAEAPEWAPRLADLKSPSAGARWSAVQDLGQTLDPDVAPHLLPMLADQDIFVRMAAARWLGELGAWSAVPALIDALEDDEASVREQADVSLRRITGRTFKFDPTASEGERAKKVKAWRDWWKREGEAELERI